MEVAPMLFAADYPFLNIFWTMILFFCWLAWISVLVMIIADLFRRHETSGWIKAMWIVVLILLPFLGVLFYLVSNGTDMSERTVKTHSVAPTTDGGPAGEISKAKALLDGGTITQSEFDSLKAKALA
jgi:hypothetical protein